MVQHVWGCKWYLAFGCGDMGREALSKGDTSEEGEVDLQK
jgi:hypothetical protein